MFSHPPRYTTQVRVRWSDLDAFGHVNNAKTLTLLEEARVDWLFTEAARQGAGRLTEGVVVSKVRVDYRRPIGFGSPVTVSMGITELRAGSTTVDYQVRVLDELAVTATTQLVPFDLPTGRPRRWDEQERAFLAGFLAAGSDGSA